MEEVNRNPEHFVAKSVRDYAWYFQSYNLIPHLFFENLGIIKNGNNSALFLKLTSSHNTYNSSNSFKTYAEIAFQHRYGICIVSHEWINEAPDIVLSYGAIWSFREYNSLVGNKIIHQNYETALRINTNNPFLAIHKDNQAISLSIPDKKFFPFYIQDALSQVIVKSLPEARPTFCLLVKDKYIMKHSIIANLNHYASKEQKEALVRDLEWYMPPYLPISIA